MHRLFVALRPPPAIRETLAAVQEGIAGARWQDDDQLHLTLRFVGEVDRHQAEDVVAALAEVRTVAPALRLDGVGRFDAKGSRHGGAALWAGVAPREPLAALHRKVDRAVTLAGLAPERRAFLPHVTLARLPRAAATGSEAEAWLARHAGLTGAGFTPTHLVLYESRLGRDGAAYDAVGRWPLVAPGSVDREGDQR